MYVMPTHETHTRYSYSFWDGVVVDAHTNLLSTCEYGVWPVSHRCWERDGCDWLVEQHSLVLVGIPLRLRRTIRVQGLPPMLRVFICTNYQYYHIDNRCVVVLLAFPSDTCTTPLSSPPTGYVDRAYDTSSYF